MPSPFPGMDPYLEGEMWQEFHDTLANEIRSQIIPQLGSRYAALLAKRYVLDRPALGVFDVPSSRTIYPDVHIVGPREAESRKMIRESTSVDEPTVELASFMGAPQLSVEIRDVAQRRLVTLIEILSPANKYGDGAREYNDRRIDLLQTEAHLLEIDLLRQGSRIPLMGEPTPAPYYVYLSRTQRRPFTQIWAVGLRDRLPVVPVPLLSPDPDVRLDLQAAVDRCFALVGYERLLNYRDPPPPPELRAADRDWVNARLATAGVAAPPTPE